MILNKQQPLAKLIAYLKVISNHGCLGVVLDIVGVLMLLAVLLLFLVGKIGQS